MRILIIVPTYNEIDNLRPLTSQIFAQFTGLSGISVPDILFVDDGSPDGTGQLAETLAKEDARIHVQHRPKKMGLGTAYVSGFAWALQKGYDAVIQMDADFSHHPKYLLKMVELLGSHDGAIGSRYVTGGGTVNWGIGRKVLSRGGSLYSRMILGAPFRDFTGGFNGWRRQVLEGVDFRSLKSDGYSFQIELKFRAYLKGYRLTEFPIIFEDRKVGTSKMNRKIVFEALARVWEFRLRASKDGNGVLGKLQKLFSGADS